MYFKIHRFIISFSIPAQKNSALRKDSGIPEYPVNLFVRCIVRRWKFDLPFDLFDPKGPSRTRISAALSSPRVAPIVNARSLFARYLADRSTPERDVYVLAMTFMRIVQFVHRRTNPFPLSPQFISHAVGQINRARPRYPRHDRVDSIEREREGERGERGAKLSISFANRLWQECWGYHIHTMNISRWDKSCFSSNSLRKAPWSLKSAKKERHRRLESMRDWNIYDSKMVVDL